MIRNGPPDRNGHAGDAAWLASGLMAQRRDMFCRSTALAAPLVVLGVLLLAGAVFVSNQVVACRLEVARLEDRRQFLEARAALLQARWNAVTAASVIQQRAELEIGLVRAAEPDPVLVQTPVTPPEGPGLWRRMLDHFGGGRTLEAATDPLGQPGEGSMVSLAPCRLEDGGR